MMILKHIYTQESKNLNNMGLITNYKQLQNKLQYINTNGSLCCHTILDLCNTAT